MPTRIGVANRIPIHIPKPIPGRRLERVRHDTIGLDETAHPRIVEAGAVIVQADIAFQPLVGKEPVGSGSAEWCCWSQLTVSVVDDLADPSVAFMADLIAAAVHY